MMTFGLNTTKLPKAACDNGEKSGCVIDTVVPNGRCEVTEKVVEAKVPRIHERRDNQSLSSDIVL